MTDTTSDCQVLVVGAGPTGLVLAAELLARGISTSVIDKGGGIILQSRATGLHARTLELLDLMGLADRFVERGQIVRRFQYYSEGKPLVNLDLSLNGSRFGFMLDIPQHETEKLLRQRVAELGGTIEQGLELTALGHHTAGVTATIRDRSGEVREIRADYLVGCDGAHSRVRDELGLSFDGHAYQEDWLLADVRLDWSRSEDEVYAFFKADGTLMSCFPMRDHVWRLIFPYTGDRGRQPPTLEEIQQLVDQRAPERIVVSDPTWLANFRSQRRSTNVYRCGRVMLAGDAAHVHSPAGGQGMNVGMLDAHNLAWKLALVASGRSSDWLLDTYGEERAPVAADVLRWTHALVQLSMVRQPLKRALRDTLVPIISRVPPVHERLVRRLSQQHIGYSSSRLTRHEGGSDGVRPGDRAPDVDVMVPGGGMVRLYEVLRGTRHVMLVSSADHLGAFERDELWRLRDIFDVVVGSFAPQHAALGRGRGESVYLIRPDGYIAARGHTDQLTGILDYLRQVFREPDEMLDFGCVDEASARVACLVEPS
ncbi:MAG: FAD-dependent monooxygenase [Chloroflexota bacterium]|nr:FAD-dependent monooxygenase [Chloroflexota bacterium]